ncbi:A/G-specific adenine glycosylase [Candidatus Saccharibacteria bacterium]|nr:A/G-specific adenine glycosylase [Candidatus Saccharibacteria bacterium]
MQIPEFIELVWAEGRRLFRDMPWRSDTRPYYVLVSEIMLQQTQVERVIPKFTAFIKRFPTIEALAEAPLADVLALWSGLGYNRRAKFLQEAARMVVGEYGGVFPDDLARLIKLPGVGRNTAGAILAYSFNQPVVFVETNIRTVYFHHFFAGSDPVSDVEVEALVEATVDQEHPREWYWALMDYGSWLKRSGVSLNALSRHYTKQAPLKGSVREIRGAILKALADGEALSEADLRSRLPVVDERYAVARAALLAEGLVAQTAERLHLAR